MTSVNLSQKERGELVTKGYFHDTLEEVLESKNYATNDRLDMVIEEVASLKVEVTESREESLRHMSALMEDNRHQISLLIEAFEARFEWIECKVFG